SRCEVVVGAILVLEDASYDGALVEVHEDGFHDNGVVSGRDDERDEHLLDDVRLVDTVTSYLLVEIRGHWLEQPGRASRARIAGRSLEAVRAGIAGRPL